MFNNIPSYIKNTSHHPKRSKINLKCFFDYTIFPQNWRNIIPDDTCGRWFSFDSFHTNNQTHSIHTRFKTNLHPPTANITKFQKAVHYSAINIFNNLPHEIKDLANDILPFRNALKRFLLTNSFYNSKEYFN